MNLGQNELIVLSILAKSPSLSREEVNVIFQHVTHKTTRINNIFHSLKIKGFLDDSGKLDSNSIGNIELVPITVDSKILDNVSDLTESFKLGKLAKSIIYVLSKHEKCSLQFLSSLFKEPVKNVYSIMLRLEEKNIVTSFNSLIRHVNSNGRRYHPKFYILTEFGSLWTQTHLNDIDSQNLDILL